MILFFFYFQRYVSNFIHRDFRFIVTWIKEEEFTEEPRYFFDQDSLFFFFFISYLSSIWLSLLVERVTVYPYPNPLEFLHCNKVSRHIGTILWSSRRIQRRCRLPLRLDFPFFFSLLFLSFRGIRTQSLSVSSLSIGSDELRSVSHANSPAKGSWKIVCAAMERDRLSI